MCAMCSSLYQSEKVHFSTTPSLHYQIKKTKRTMKQNISDTSSNVLLTGTILLANFDFTSLLDYSIKAFVGGAIWMGFQLANEFIRRKIKK
jgi:hypothetical protein